MISVVVVINVVVVAAVMSRWTLIHRVRRFYRVCWWRWRWRPIMPMIDLTDVVVMLMVMIIGMIIIIVGIVMMVVMWRSVIHRARGF